MAAKRVLMLASLLLSAALARADAATVDDRAARALLDQAIAAHGGEAALGKIVAVSFKVVGNEFVGDTKLPRNYEAYLEGAEKMRCVVLDAAGKAPKYIEVINGRHGWAAVAGQPVRHVAAVSIDSQCDDGFMNWAKLLAPLKKPGVQLSSVKDVTLDGRRLQGLLVKYGKCKPFKFYFDARTHLLVMRELTEYKAEVEGEVTERTIWSDFEDVQGTKQGMTITELWDGVEIAAAKVADLKFYEKPLDKKLFERP